MTEILNTILVTLPCDGGCGTDISARSVALPGGKLYCELCGGQEALAILANVRSSKHDREMADGAVKLIDIWRKLDAAKQRRAREAAERAAVLKGLVP